ncbi:MAG: 3D domain-containing protein [Planctomycetes bacterium]|nr:3D domain-containing protein [Planctomycetota bacterium]
MGKFEANKMPLDGGLMSALTAISPLLLLAFLVEVDLKAPSLQAVEMHSSSAAVLDDFFQPDETEEVVKDAQQEIDEQNVYSDFIYERTLVAKVTAYTPGKESCGKFSDGMTSTGTDAWKLTGVAADPSVLPYGAWVHIPGVGYREVDDTGTAMRESWKNDGVVHIDLRFAELAKAKAWGVQEMKIHLYLAKPKD